MRGLKPTLGGGLAALLLGCEEDAEASAAVHVAEGGARCFRPEVTAAVAAVAPLFGLDGDAEI